MHPAHGHTDLLHRRAATLARSCRAHRLSRGTNDALGCWSDLLETGSEVNCSNCRSETVVDHEWALAELRSFIQMTSLRQPSSKRSRSV